MSRFIGCLSGKAVNGSLKLAEGVQTTGIRSERMTTHDTGQSNVHRRLMRFVGDTPNRGHAIRSRMK